MSAGAMRCARLLRCTPLILGVLTPGCSDGRTSPAPPARDVMPAPAPADSSAARARSAELTAAAHRIIDFLRGERGFDAIRLADTVTLYLAPDGGGTRIALARDALADPAAWSIRSPAGATYTLVPPDGRLTTASGVHFNCYEYALSSRFPELASLPHVGVRVMAASDGSCLQSWNMTLIFEAQPPAPTLVGVVYDQWEW